MAEEVPVATKSTPDTTTPHLRKTRMIAAGAAAAGLLVGSLLDIGVEMGVEKTGLLGPSVESLLVEQESNFDEINRRLDTLKTSSENPDVQSGLADLGNLLQRQDELAGKANAELRYLAEQVSAMRAQQLAESGYSGGADFWLKNGESVNVGSHGQVFSLIGARHPYADVNLSGTRKRVVVGDAIQFPGAENGCTVFFKQATPRPDGRFGFDLNCT